MKRLLILLCVALLGCQSGGFSIVHKPPMQQGNLLEADKMDQLELGMTQEQVEFLLGAPISHDSFGYNRYDYVYYYKEKFKDPVHKKLTIYFEEGKVVRIVE